jgi:hypothetical protein
VYIFDFTVGDVIAQDMSVGIFEFQLVGTSNSVYAATSVLAATVLSVVILNPGQKTQGQIAFEIPRSDSPATLEYASGSVQATDNALPAPSANVSAIIADYGGNLTGPAASQVQINTLDDVNFSTQTQGYWYSGDIIGVNISLGFSLQYNGNGSDIYQVTSITDTDGLQIVGYTPDLPVSFGQSGTYITVWVLIPADAYSGGLDFVVNIT